MLSVSAGRATARSRRCCSLDDYALFFIGLLALATAGVVAALVRLPRSAAVHPEEYYMLLLTGHARRRRPGRPATHFASFFLGLEILSVSLYALIAYPRAARGLRRGGGEVPGAGRRHRRVPAVRHGARLRRARHDEPGRRSPRCIAGGRGRDLAAHRRRRADPRRHRLQARPSCRSTCGRPTSTRARRRR